MAVNVTQKDKTLSEVIDWCRQHIAGIEEMIPDATTDGFLTGERFALQTVVGYCKKRLGYSGSMPLEVPNRSEQVHDMSTRVNCLKVGEEWWDAPVYECSCGYSTRDEYEARSHINVQKQLRKE